MSSKVPRPEYAGQINYFPVNFGDRDVIVGRLMGILEAVMPESRQLDATKNLVKKEMSAFFIDEFNDMYDNLLHAAFADGDKAWAQEAIWLAQVDNMPSTEPAQES